MASRCSSIALPLMLLVLAGPSAGVAQTAQGVAAGRAALTLSWVRLSGAEGCPDAITMAKRVETHMGRSVFWAPADADRSIEAVVERNKSRWRLRVSLESELGRRGERVIEAGGADCEALAGSAVLVIAALVDPQDDVGAPRFAPELDTTLHRTFGGEPSELDPATLPSAPSPAPGPSPATTPIPTGAATPADTLTPAPPRDRWTLALTLSGSLGKLPSWGPGTALSATWYPIRFWPVQLEAFGMGPGTAEAPHSAGYARLYLLGAKLRLCPWADGGFLLCGGAATGALLGNAAGFVSGAHQVGPAASLDAELHGQYTFSWGSTWACR